MFVEPLFTPSRYLSACWNVKSIISEMQSVVYCRSYSGTYCDNCDVTDHDIEDCLELISENLSPDRLAEIGISTN